MDWDTALRYANSGTDVRRQEPVIGLVGVCVYHEGTHYPGKHCPHGEEVEKTDQPGWTSQQAANEGPRE